MKYVASLILGITFGVIVAMALLLFNPFTVGPTLSPLSVSGEQQLTFSYSTVAADSVAFTNDGESRVSPYPEKVLQLWEEPIRQSEILVTELYDARNDVVGLGIKYSSLSEQTRILEGEALVDSAWHIYLPEHGGLFVYQTENWWNFMREVVVPAEWSSANNWKGTWIGNMTSGPGTLGTGVATGTGEFAELNAEVVETVSAEAYSAETGPVSMSGRLILESRDKQDAYASRDVIADN